MKETKEDRPLELRLEELKQLEKKYKPKINKKGLSKEESTNLKIAILKEFYEEDPLAYDVARGEKSYTKLIEPIGGKYNSFLRRVFSKRDKKFDGEVGKVIKSINNVRLDSVCEDFTTKGIKRYINKKTMESLFIGAFIGGMPLVVQSISYWNAQDAELVLPKAVEYIKFAAPLFVGLYGLFMLRANYCIKNSVNDLEKIAKKADEFLRKHYIK